MVDVLVGEHDQLEVLDRDAVRGQARVERASVSSMSGPASTSVSGSPRSSHVFTSPIPNGVGSAIRWMPSGSTRPNLCNGACSPSGAPPTVAAMLREVADAAFARRLTPLGLALPRDLGRRRGLGHAALPRAPGAPARRARRAARRRAAALVAVRGPRVLGGRGARGRGRARARARARAARAAAARAGARGRRGGAGRAPRARSRASCGARSGARRRRLRELRRALRPPVRPRDPGRARRRDDGRRTSRCCARRATGARAPGSARLRRRRGRRGAAHGGGRAAARADPRRHLEPARQRDRRGRAAARLPRPPRHRVRARRPRARAAPTSSRGSPAGAARRSR